MASNQKRFSRALNRIDLPSTFRRAFERTADRLRGEGKLRMISLRLGMVVLASDIAEIVRRALLDIPMPEYILTASVRAI